MKITKTVVVYMEGGAIQDIEVPAGVEVVVRDWDTEDCQPEDYGDGQWKTDCNGKHYTEITWT
jgi:uncharacterized protein YbdZ (MbtH family)